MNKNIKGNEKCVKDCEKQGPCESCSEFKDELSFADQFDVIWKDCDNWDR